MNVIDETVDAAVSTEFKRAVIWNTEIVSLENGEEMRNARWNYPKLKFSGEFLQLSATAQDALTRMFYVARGPLYGFRYLDPLDHQAEHEPLVVTPATTHAAALFKTYQIGQNQTQRPIQALRNCTVYDSAGHTVEGSLDTVLGLFTPTAPWGDGPYSWSGHFDVWVRFSHDQLETSHRTTSVAIRDCELLEMRARR